MRRLRPHGGEPVPRAARRRVRARARGGRVRRRAAAGARSPPATEVPDDRRVRARRPLLRRDALRGARPLLRRHDRALPQPPVHVLEPLVASSSRTAGTSGRRCRSTTGILIVLAGHVVAFLLPRSCSPGTRSPLRLYVLEGTGARVRGCSRSSGLVNIVRAAPRRPEGAASRRRRRTGCVYGLLARPARHRASTSPSSNTWGSSWFAAVADALPAGRSRRFSPDLAWVAPLPAHGRSSTSSGCGRCSRSSPSRASSTSSSSRTRTSGAGPRSCAGTASGAAHRPRRRVVREFRPGVRRRRSPVFPDEASPMSSLPMTSYGDRFRAFRKVGHLPTLLTSLLYFDFCFAIWVLNGAMAPYISAEFGLSPSREGLHGLGAGDRRRADALPARRLLAVHRAQERRPDRDGHDRRGPDGGLPLRRFATRACSRWGSLLGIAGASFGVALSLGSGWYPPKYKGLAMGIAGAGNSGAVLAVLFAPPLASAYGWRAVYGIAAIPMLVAMVLLQIFAKEPPDREHKSLKDYLKVLVDRDAWVFNLLYMVTFGGLHRAHELPARRSSTTSTASRSRAWGRTRPASSSPRACFACSAAGSPTDVGGLRLLRTLTSAIIVLTALAPRSCRRVPGSWSSILIALLLGHGRRQRRRVPAGAAPVPDDDRRRRQPDRRGRRARRRVRPQRDGHRPPGDRELRPGLPRRHGALDRRAAGAARRQPAVDADLGRRGRQGPRHAPRAASVVRRRRPRGAARERDRTSSPAASRPPAGASLRGRHLARWDVEDPGVLGLDGPGRRVAQPRDLDARAAVRRSRSGDSGRSSRSG